MFFLGKIEAVTKLVDNVTARQNEVENKVNEIASMVDSIEKDIYLDGQNDYDLEIVCPYCDYNFLLDPDDLKDEVQCPECNNIIEVDWDADSFDNECSGSCGHCSHGCGDEQDDTQNEKDDDDDM